MKEYESLGKNFDSIDEFPSLLKELNNRYIQYSTDPRINFMSFISYLQTSTILLNSEMNIIENDFDKIVSLVTDFNIGQNILQYLMLIRILIKRLLISHQNYLLTPLK